MHKIDRTLNLRKNIKYLFKTRGETQVSLCKSSGLTRTTIYKILEGKVIKVHHSTIQKISDFFDVSCHEIQTIDLEEKETLETNISFNGDINPSAVPIIKERHLIQSLNKKIGTLVATHPLTYYFGYAQNMICVLLENDIKDSYEKGNLLIIKKGSSRTAADTLIYENETKKLLVIQDDYFDPQKNIIIGEIVEERF